MKQLNPVQGDGADKIFRKGKEEYKVVMEDGEEFVIEGDECSCGHERDFTPSPTESFGASYTRRISASCQHQVAVLNSQQFGPCEDCGAMKVRENKMSHGGRHVMSKYVCAECGNRIDMK